MNAPWTAFELDPYRFACDGPLWGIPHFANVVTNLPFLALGFWGLRFLRRRGLWGDPAFAAWRGLWVSTAAVCAGSGAYHWFLVPWGLGLDRMAISGIVAFLGAHLADVALGLGRGGGLRWLLFGACQLTVLVWWLGGGAWAYGALQAGGALGALWVTVRAARRGRLAVSPRPLYGFLACYALAKVCEALDEPICRLTGCLGGHALKHVLSAVALAVLARMMVSEAARVPAAASRAPAAT